MAGERKDRTLYRSFHGLRPPPSMKTEIGRLVTRQQQSELWWDHWTWMHCGSGLNRGCQKLSASSPRPSPPPKRGGRSLRTATGEDLERLVVVSAVAGAWALGCNWAMDMVDARDQKDQRDERLRLDRTQRVAWGAVSMGSVQGRINGCGFPVGLGITRLNTLNHSWSGLVTLKSWVFFGPCVRPSYRRGTIGTRIGQADLDHNKNQIKE
ncbi:MAG: hypothetical protein JWR26_3924 [Pedosphaera sp.]|nr:hypothetical protein [Pedosphaera sp.]